MSIKAIKLLGGIGGSLGVLVALFMFSLLFLYLFSESLGIAFGVVYGASGITAGIPPYLVMLASGIVPLILALLGIVAGNIAERDRKRAGKLMLVSGILGFFVISWYWLLPGALLIAGAILSFLDNGSMPGK